MVLYNMLGGELPRMAPGSRVAFRGEVWGSISDVAKSLVAHMSPTWSLQCTSTWRDRVSFCFCYTNAYYTQSEHDV